MDVINLLKLKKTLLPYQEEITLRKIKKIQKNQIIKEAQLPLNLILIIQDYLEFLIYNYHIFIKFYLQDLNIFSSYYFKS